MYSEIRQASFLIFTYRESCEFLVVSVHSSEDLLTVSLQLLQLLLDDSCIQRFTLLNQSITLPEHQLDLPRVQVDLLLKRLLRNTFCFFLIYPKLTRPVKSSSQVL